MLDRLALEDGAHAVDVGCGPIGIMNLLSERVGARGTVVGVEREPRFVDMARAEIEKSSLHNVKVIHAHALDMGLEKGAFDYVHERLMLINLPRASQDALLTDVLPPQAWRDHGPTRVRFCIVCLPPRASILDPVTQDLE
jgi:ubiquinone/menaquinone biosynthesis C-methylase UbiE